LTERQEGKQFFFEKKKFFFHLSGKAGGVTPRTLAAEADYGV